MMSGGAPDCSAVSTRCGSPSEVVTSSRSVIPGFSASNFAASSLARASPQFGVHQTISPAIAAPPGAKLETVRASSATARIGRISSSPAGRPNRPLRCRSPLSESFGRSGNRPQLYAWQ